jgi:hypothetical protein
MDLLLENAGLVAFGLAAGKCWTCCWMDLCPERWKVLDLLLSDLLLERAGLVAGWTCVQNAYLCMAMRNIQLQEMHSPSR